MIGNTTRSILNAPVVTGDFVILVLGNSSVTPSLTTAMGTAFAGLGSSTIRSGAIKSIVISNDSGAVAYIKTRDGAVAGRGIKLADGDSLFLAIDTLPTGVDEIYYEGTSLSVAVFY